jgi:hypothetical protein
MRKRHDWPKQDENDPAPVAVRRGFVMERFGSLRDADCSFDIEYWQRQGDAAIFEAAWELAVFYHRDQGMGPDVSFDRPRVLRVLDRIIADVDGLAGFPPIAEEEAKKGGAEARRVRHRRRLAEPDPPPKRLTVQEERAALRALLNLPPSKKG